MKSSDLPWFTKQHTLAGVVFGTLAALPIIETFVFDVYVDAGSRELSGILIVRIVLLVIILWLLMVLSFTLDVDRAGKLAGRYRTWLRVRQKHLKRDAIRALLMLAVLVVLFAIGGESLLGELWHQVLSSGATLVAEAIGVGVLVSLVAAAIRTSGSLTPNLRVAMDSWGLCLQISGMFYFVLIAATLLMVRFNGVPPAARLGSILTIAKDYILLFIISNILYLGLFRIGAAGRLVEVFRNRRGFLLFVIICGIIAVFAVWADFGSLHANGPGTSFIHPWQSTLNTLHVYIRDIGLLLLPIAGLLFWTLKRVAEELRNEEKSSEPAGRAL